MRRTASRLALPVLLILATTGCSFAFAKGPPRGHEEMAEFTCTQDKAIPIVDAIGAGLFAVAGVLFFVGAGQEDDGYFTSEDLSRWGAVSLGVSVPLGLSSFVGNRRVNECRAALEELGQPCNGIGGLLRFSEGKGIEVVQ